MNTEMLMAEIGSRDIRLPMFQAATRYVDYECVHGDIVEFGVYTGRSLALLAHCHLVNCETVHTPVCGRCFIGVDSFRGLPASTSNPRLRKGVFARNHSYHPTCRIGQKVTPKVTEDLFKRYELGQVTLIKGEYRRLKPFTRHVAIVHIDCDLAHSTFSALNIVGDMLQDGSVILFDDWFNFKADPYTGEQSGFKAFKAQPRIASDFVFVEYQTYATFGKSFIVRKMKV